MRSRAARTSLQPVWRSCPESDAHSSAIGEALRDDKNNFLKELNFTHRMPSPRVGCSDRGPWRSGRGQPTAEMSAGARVLTFEQAGPS